MGKEMEEAQKLTRNDLLAKLEKGRPTNLGRRPRDANRLASAIAGDATEPHAGLPVPPGFSQVTIGGCTFADDGEAHGITLRGDTNCVIEHNTFSYPT